MQQWFAKPTAKLNQPAMIRFAVFLAFLALLTGAVIPRGYMAAQAADGGVTIRFCSAANGNSKWISPDDPEYQTYLLIYGDDADHAGVGDSGDDEGDASCDMGLPPIPSRDFVWDEIALTQFISAVPTLPILSGIFPRGLPPATGPPVS